MSDRIMLEAVTPSGFSDREPMRQRGYFLAAFYREDFRNGGHGRHKGVGVLLIDCQSGRVFEAWAEDCTEVSGAAP